jgi:hypothetical protein
MWEMSRLGFAQLQADGWDLTVATVNRQVRDNRGTAVRMLVRKGKDASTAVSLSIPGVEVAPIGESFVRGSTLCFSQVESPDHPVGLELSFTVIAGGSDLLVIESVISIKTSLWDAWPRLELGVGSITRENELGKDYPLAPMEGGSCHWWSATPQQGSSGTVLTHLACDERDSQSLDRVSAVRPGSVGFFGDFLERGVIRRIRPWWVWSARPLDSLTVANLGRQIEEKPLPLTN